MNDAQRYEAALNALHDKTPAPFNPHLDPKAKGRSEAVTASMKADGFYDSHTREQCAAEYQRRYDELKAAGN